MRNAYDFYPTPAWCYESIDFDWSKFTTAYEPCEGDGRITKFLNQRGVLATGNDVQALGGVDFLTDHKREAELILTNPPFSLAEMFIRKALREAPAVMMLLRLNFLGSQARHKFWCLNPPTGLIVLSKRPSFTGFGTDSTEYAWFIWDRTGKLPVGFTFIK